MGCIGPPELAGDLDFPIRKSLDFPIWQGCRPPISRLDVGYQPPISRLELGYKVPELVGRLNFPIRKSYNFLNTYSSLVVISLYK